MDEVGVVEVEVEVEVEAEVEVKVVWVAIAKVSGVAWRRVVWSRVLLTCSRVLLT